MPVLELIVQPPDEVSDGERSTSIVSHPLFQRMMDVSIGSQVFSCTYRSCERDGHPSVERIWEVFTRIRTDVSNAIPDGSRIPRNTIVSCSVVSFPAGRIESKMLSKPLIVESNGSTVIAGEEEILVICSESQSKSER